MPHISVLVWLFETAYYAVSTGERLHGLYHFLNECSFFIGQMVLGIELSGYFLQNELSEMSDEAWKNAPCATLAVETAYYAVSVTAS